jgi:hypothetical protein
MNPHDTHHEFQSRDALADAKWLLVNAIAGAVTVLVVAFGVVWACVAVMR